MVVAAVEAADSTVAAEVVEHPTVAAAAAEVVEHPTVAVAITNSNIF
jgi:hypothetical protein